jgi:hypothetical protein
VEEGGRDRWRRERWVEERKIKVVRSLNVSERLDVVTGCKGYSPLGQGG